MPFSYAAFGLCLRCNQPLAGLLSIAESVVDVEISLCAMPAQSERLLADELPYRASPERLQNGTPYFRVTTLASGGFFRFLYQSGEAFVIDRSGSRIWATWPASGSLQQTSLFLLGPVLSFALRLRSVLSFHASAIIIDGRAIAFTGPSGAGKSTIAAACAQRGYSVLSDDQLAVTFAGSSVLVQPAYPRLRLWPESVEFLFGSRELLPLLVPAAGSGPVLQKRYRDLNPDTGEFSSDAVPLSAIYLLDFPADDSPRTGVTSLTGQAALIALTANTSVNYLLDGAMRARELQQIGQLLAAVPVRAAHRDSDLAQLTDLCDAILKDVDILHDR